MGYFRAIVAFCLAVFLFSQVAQCNKEQAARTYDHAAVGDIIMPYYYDCDLGVLYNSDGVPMISGDGYPIECYSIELKNRLYKIVPNPEPLERMEVIRGEPRG